MGFGLHTVGLEERVKKGLAQIQQNMMQLAALNDEIRNPLTVIRLLISMEDIPINRKTIDEQIDLINEIVRQLDIGWVNSEKVWKYLRTHYGIQRPDEDK